MTQQPSGWYDDPQDATKLRYWDGVIWSDHVVPKVSPTAAQSHIGAAYDVGRAADRRHGNSNDPVTPVAPEASGGPGSQGTPSPWGQQPGGVPGYQPAPQWQATQLGLPLATTPDGAVLAGWWKRVLARILDGIFAFVLGLPLTGYFLYHAFQASRTWVDQLSADAAAGRTSSFLPPAEVSQWLLAASLLWLLVVVAYEVFFLSRSGATPGKMIVGLSVRLRDRPGPPPMSAIWRRVGVMNGLQLISRVPVLGSLADLASLVNYLWPLWDPKKQALHDKAAATNVVVGPQPPRS